MLIGDIQQDLYKSCILVEKIHGMLGKDFIIQYIRFAAIESFVKRENCWKNQKDEGWNIVEQAYMDYKL